MILEADRVSAGYGADDVLRDVTVRVASGEFVALAGPNGSGKSTLLRVLGRVLRPRTGRATLDGRDVAVVPAREAARAVGVLPQETHLEFAFTVHEVVLMGRSPHLGLFQSEGPRDRDVVRDVMERTGTWELRDRSFLELSGGERQRVALARALAQEPSILLLDEPTAHLDLAYQARILRGVRALRDERKVGVVAAIHDLNLAAAISDRIVLLSAGRIAASGTPAEVLTEAVLRPVFGPEVQVGVHPRTGGPLVLVSP